MKSEIAVVGAGFSGIFAAGKAALDGAKVTLIEKMPEILFRYSQENTPEMLTNNSQRLRFQSRILRGSEFMETALKLFSPNKLLIQLEGMGIPVRIIDEEFVFPKDNHHELVLKLKRWLANCGVTVITNSVLKEVIVDKGICRGVRFEQNGEEITLESSAVILATGGLGNSEYGASGDGFPLLDQVGHHMIAPEPALAPLKLREDSPFDPLAGLTLNDSRIYLWKEGKKLDDRRGVIRFIPGGIGGGAAEDLCDAVLNNDNTTLTLELLPHIDEGEFDKEISDLFNSSANEKVVKLLSKYIPRRLCKLVVSEIAALSEDITGGTITAKQRKALRGAIYRMPLPVDGVFPVEKAVDTAGGADLTSFNQDTMESYVSSGLYVSGEILDITTRWGGYSMHCAISTGRLAGMSAVQSIRENR